MPTSSRGSRWWPAATPRRSGWRGGRPTTRSRTSAPSGACWRRAVLEADREATAPDGRENGTLWMRRFDAKRQVRLPAPEASRAPGLRLTVDTLADLQCARQVATELAARGWDPRLAPLPEV